jgi:hypothetical protein
LIIFENKLKEIPFEKHFGEGGGGAKFNAFLILTPEKRYCTFGHVHMHNLNLFSYTDGQY